jgi:hypothetical protein
MTCGWNHFREFAENEGNPKTYLGEERSIGIHVSFELQRAWNRRLSLSNKEAYVSSDCLRKPWEKLLPEC